MCKVAGVVFHVILVSFLLFQFICAEDELVFVNIIYRHGDRTPVDPYPTDPYNSSYWPQGLGQLTNIGKRQHFKLGKWLRQRYSTFLPEKYCLNDIYVRATDVDRTLMSAESNLAGLYSPIGSDVWDETIKWQPIPVHTVPEKADAVLAGKKHCPRFDMEVQALLQDDEFKRISLELKPLYDYVSNHSGKPIFDIQTLEYLYNTLYIENLNKLKLPDWTKDIFPEKLLPWAYLSFQIYCYTAPLQRLKVGPLMTEVVNRLVNKSEGILKPDRKMWIYSAHDTTVANVLMAFGAFEPHCPPYASTIILELRLSATIGYYVSAFYKNGTDAHPISILSCESKCPLEKMQTLLDPIMLSSSEWEKECQSLSAPVVSTIVAIAVVSCGILLLLLLTSLCVGAVCSKRHRSRNQLYQPLSDDIN